MINREGHITSILFIIGFLLAGGSALFSGGAAADHLPRSTLTIDTGHGPVRFEVEIAANDAARSLGLMYRTHLGKNAGMLFEFPDDHYRIFWMKNTVLSLDMLFIRKDGTISSIAPNTTPYSENEISSMEPVRAVLEINAGRTAALGIAPGRKVHGSFFENAKAKP